MDPRRRLSPSRFSRTMNLQHLTWIQNSPRIERRLQRPHDVESDGILRFFQQLALKLTDSMFGGNRAMELRDNAMHDVVHRLPLREKRLLVGADRLGHVEMDVAVAKMTERHDARIRHKDLYGLARAREELGRCADRHADVVFDRAALKPLHLREGFAQKP